MVSIIPAFGRAPVNRNGRVSDRISRIFLLDILLIMDLWTFVSVVMRSINGGPKDGASVILTLLTLRFCNNVGGNE